MNQKTRHICKCGGRAVVEELDNGAWYCLQCALNQMLDDIRLGLPVKIAFSELRIVDVLLAPGDDNHPDLFANLVDVLPITLWKN